MVSGFDKAREFEVLADFRSNHANGTRVYDDVCRGFYVNE
uniref:Uncharacterized protein n=1 Tax=Podoviridae sp. ctrub15 TaxID=2826581 RepID=A0A8S5LV70_9CAUD|nr:MAG TPA: hypothetical protein [Podoviridae sp. ctrub15]